MEFRKLLPQELQALREYADRKGRTWKSALMDDWAFGRTSGWLQNVRNEFGPEWLLKFKLEGGG